MRIELNARVRTRDGEDVGDVEQVIFDAQERAVLGVVVNTTAFLVGDDVIVPLGDIESASEDGDVITLRLTRDQFDRLERFVAEDYDLAPVGWVPPPGGIAWGVPADAYLWAIPETSPSRPPHVEKGSPVVDRDGDEVGVVEDVEIAADSGRVERFKVKLGGALERLFGAATEVELLPADVEEIADGEVRLARDKDELIEH